MNRLAQVFVIFTSAAATSSAFGLVKSGSGNTVGIGSLNCETIVNAFDIENLQTNTRAGAQATDLMMAFEHWVSGYMTARIQTEFLGMESGDEVTAIRQKIIKTCRAKPQQMVGRTARDVMDSYIKTVAK